jgi:hypothetical protein
VSEAEAFSLKVQADVLEDARQWAAAQGRDLSGVRIMSTVHTDINMFVRSQPTISEVSLNSPPGATHSMGLRSRARSPLPAPLIIIFLNIMF